MAKKGGVKKTALSRTFHLLGMASKAAFKSRIEQARVIAEGLSQLKGAAMKAGQLLSLDVADYFPPEAIEILTKLQANADPVPFDELKVVLKDELGGKLADIKNLDPTPAASASIGQVHRAKVKGRDVALKIQYPGVRESIDSDIRVLEKLAGGLVSVMARNIDLREAFEELRIVLNAEADYENELRNMQEYRNL